MGPRIGAGATSRDLARRSRGRAKRVRSRGPRRPQHLCPKAKHPIMKLTIERAALLKSLTHVPSVVERRNTIPILSNVLIEADGEPLSLTATDMDMTVTHRLPATVGQIGRAHV